MKGTETASAAISTLRKTWMCVAGRLMQMLGRNKDVFWDREILYGSSAGSGEREISPGGWLAELCTYNTTGAAAAGPILNNNT